jgi:sec-independent protein translocase protein TatA
MAGFGIRELVIVLLVVLVVFGAKKLRTVGSDLGQAVRGFKRAMNESEEEQSSLKQIRAEGTGAEFAEAAKRRDTKTERSG